MNAHMTTGTLDFLKQLEAKYQAISFYFMSNENSTLAYYEGKKKKSIFQAGRSYDILLSKGKIEKQGYVVMNNIPVTEDGAPVFEDRFSKRQHEMDLVTGFQAFRLLKPVKGYTYIVFTQWTSKQAYTNWKESAAFKKAHEEQATKPPAYFSDRPFISAYYMYEEEAK